MQKKRRRKKQKKEKKPSDISKNAKVNQFQWLLPEKQFGCLEMDGIPGPNTAPLQLLSCNFTVIGAAGSYSFGREQRLMDTEDTKTEKAQSS